MLMLLEPIDVMFVLGANRLHQFPVAPRMIHVNEMADFMGDHVINDAVRRQHDQPVVLQYAGRRTVPPFRLGFTKLDLCNLVIYP